MKLSVTLFMTIDGICQAPGGPDEDREGGFEHGGWLVPYFDDDFGKAVDARFADADAFLYGRKTYEIFAAHWPNVTDEDDPVATKFNSLPKYVPSGTLTDPEWEGTTVLKGDLSEEVEKLKGQDGRELQVHGSVALVRSLLEADLVDELQLMIAPVILGTGKRPFDGIMPTALELADSKTTSTGLMIQTYRNAGRPSYGLVGT